MKNEMTHNEQIDRANNWRRDVINVLTKEAVYSVDYKPGTGVQPSFTHIDAELSIRACRPSSLGFTKQDLEHFRIRHAQNAAGALEDIRTIKGRMFHQVGGVGVSKKDTEALKVANRDLAISKIILSKLDAQIKDRILVIPTLSVEHVETKKLEAVAA